jgi:Pyruvate/2-oxoacid:ferredoxin oxidoreductase delta subunit
MTDVVASIDPKLCKGCSTCIDICPKQSIRMVEEDVAEK